MRRMMRKIASMRKMMRKIMRKIASMISLSEGEYSRSQQHKTFECHLMAQNIYYLSN